MARRVNREFFLPYSLDVKRLVKFRLAQALAKVDFQP
jgi:hypothetical protein